MHNIRRRHQARRLHCHEQAVPECRRRRKGAQRRRRRSIQQRPRTSGCAICSTGRTASQHTLIVRHGQKQVK
eukprot:6870616-Pyramimonas_sp.AAC.1